MNRGIYLNAALGMLLACAGEPALSQIPAAPEGLSSSWAFNDCAPWDGAATLIYLADSTAPAPVPPIWNTSYPHLWVSLYRPAADLAGQTFRWDSDEKNVAGAMWCVGQGECEASIEATVRFSPFEAESGDLDISGAVDLVFPVKGRVVGGFRAVWIEHQPICG